MRKSKRKKKPVCGRESILVRYYLLSTFNCLILTFFILSLCVCDSKKINVCEMEKSCTCVKKKCKQLSMVEGQLVINIFFNVFFLDFLDVMKVIFFSWYKLLLSLVWFLFSLYIYIYIYIYGTIYNIKKVGLL